ncbi:bifunctional aspartate kinase/homoserine dehydrogenase I [Lacinutrix salivirga]
MKVLKFGGTSVGSSKNINLVISILEKQAKSSKLICVVSAVGGITNKLLEAGELAKNKDSEYKKVFKNIKKIHVSITEELIVKNNKKIVSKIEKKLEELKELLDGIYLINELSPKTLDKLLSFGELLSSFIIAETMEVRGIDAKRKNTQELLITDNNYTKAQIDFNVSKANIKAYFDKADQQITILPGFIAKSKTGVQTTLGRGGSDFTASVIASALKVEELEIWTDVSGMFTANPKLVKEAFPIKQLSYQEAMELSHFGAKVLYAPTVQPALDANIPINIKNTLKPEDVGTLITKEEHNNTTTPVKGISHISNIALITLQGSGMVGIPGFSKRLFETLAQEKINVILITQASSEHSICIAIDESEAEKAKELIDFTFQNEIALHKIDPIRVESELAILALVGDKMKKHQGISGRMFSTLGKNNINIRAIAQGASERNISTVILEKHVKKALNALHDRFFEGNNKQLNVFITGVGNVGQKLIEQIQEQKNYLKNQLKTSINIVGISNSRNMVFDANGIDLNQWPIKLRQGQKSSITGFFEQATAMNLRNSIFVDITANKAVSETYKKYLKESIAVVACNKIACSGSLEEYKTLKKLSLKYNTPFYFETNVGAGLPVLDTLNNLMASGDKISSIEAVLSGSLNFIFNNFSERTNFHDTVKRAQFEGFTEPDPRIDLSGVDVARKILILARESGIDMAFDDISMSSFLTERNLNSDTVDDFYDTLKEDEPHFQKLYAEAKNKDAQLKFVAQIKKDKASTGLKHIEKGHPFYNLEGKDNIVMFYTERYKKQPLIIKGAGAGADVTASGLFADIIRVSNS